MNDNIMGTDGVGTSARPAMAAGPTRPAIFLISYSTAPTYPHAVP